MKKASIKLIICYSPTQSIQNKMTVYTNFNEINFNEIIFNDTFQAINLNIYSNDFQIFILLLFIYCFLVINTPVIIFIIIIYELF